MPGATEPRRSLCPASLRVVDDYLRGNGATTAGPSARRFLSNCSPLTATRSLLTDSYRHQGQRRALARELRQRGIHDERVLGALATVPRHLFFEPAFQAHAYQDKAFPIGEGQTISQPYTVAFQTQLLGVAPADRVLEVGTGSGYQCAVLLQLTPHVDSIEVNEVLFARTRQRLAALGADG
ncbi:MAG: hypothetical protein H7330_12295, partial [Hymenobacteraceae bacterium]|nr:hypothetical protein [Hymenobacteraceae bacterium]